MGGKERRISWWAEIAANLSLAGEEGESLSLGIFSCFYVTCHLRCLSGILKKKV